MAVRAVGRAFEYVLCVDELRAKSLARTGELAVASATRHIWKFLFRQPPLESESPGNTRVNQSVAAIDKNHCAKLVDDLIAAGLKDLAAHFVRY